MDCYDMSKRLQKLCGTFKTCMSSSHDYKLLKWVLSIVNACKNNSSLPGDHNWSEFLQFYNLTTLKSWYWWVLMEDDTKASTGGWIDSKTRRPEETISRLCKHKDRSSHEKTMMVQGPSRWDICCNETRNNRWILGFVEVQWKLATSEIAHHVESVISVCKEENIPRIRYAIVLVHSCLMHYSLLSWNTKWQRSRNLESLWITKWSYEISYSNTRIIKLSHGNSNSKDNSSLFTRYWTLHMVLSIVDPSLIICYTQNWNKSSIDYIQALPMASRKDCLLAHISALSPAPRSRGGGAGRPRSAGCRLLPAPVSAAEVDADRWASLFLSLDWLPSESLLPVNTFAPPPCNKMGIEVQGMWASRERFQL